MKRFLAYLWYVLRHKWYVFSACCQLRIPWRGLVHDLSKFSRTEWGPYTRQFFNPDGTRRDVRNADGSYDPNAQPDEFKAAWLHHQRNKHHWQAWVSLGDGGSLTPLPIPTVYCIEMIADWMGAGMAIAGRKNPVPWYEANKDKMIMDPRSRAMIESRLHSPQVQGWNP